MGGKHKQAQRTKNNTRPSSSGRSAELLGSSIPTFVGFSTGKDGGFVPVIPGFGGLGIDDIDPNIDSNFQLVLKKMNKKDAVTKHKALQEFIELVNGCELDILKTVLPFWPRLYCSLAVDAEHRVREASHLAQRTVAVKAKRNLAPYLKQLIGPWFTSQYDSYAPAASAAQQAFQDAFPASKLPEVIAFCQEEILSYIYENLIQSVPQSTTNKNLSEDEVEARYQRILVASLQGYALYLRKVPPPQIEVASESNKKLITNSKFWKLSKHKSPFIRTAWFSTLGALLQCAPTCLLENEGQRVTTTVLANLDETDPTVLPVVWETALLALFTVQDWWMHINVEKLVLPKLWRVLRDAAQGNATSIYPNLLPLISKFPPGSDANAFYSTFFDNIRLGLNQKSVQQSRSELNSVVTSFTECLQYVILKNQNDLQLCESLIKNQLIITIKWCILDGHFATKTIFGQITNLIHYWSRNRNNIETPLYPQIVTLFWNELTQSCTTILNKMAMECFDKELNNIIHTKVIELLYALRRNNHNTKLKKQLRVQFSERVVVTTATGCGGENSIDSTDSSQPLSDTTTLIQNNDQLFMNELNLIVNKICVFYMNNVPKCIDLYLFHFYSLIQEFDSLNLFKYLCDNLNATGVYALFDQVFNGWLIIGEETDTIVDLTFILFKYLESNEIDLILNNFIQLNNEKVLLRCVAQSLAHPFRNMDVVRSWLKREEIDKLLENCCMNIIADKEVGNPENMGLLRLACAPDDNGGILISTEALIKIVNIFCKPLLNPQEYPITLDACARFAAVLSAFLYSDENVHIYTDLDLLVALFSLNTNANITNDTLSDDTLWEINTAWQDAITVLRTKYSLDSMEIINITNRFAQALKSTITPTLNVDDLINKIVQLSIEFITACCPNSTVGRVSFILNMILQHFDVTSRVKYFTQICLNAETINGVFVSPENMICVDELYLEKFKNCSTVEESIDIYEMITCSKFAVQLVCKLYEKPDKTRGSNENDDDDEEEEEDDDDELENNENNTLPLSILTPEIENDIIFHIFTCSVLNTYSNYFKITKQYDAIKINLPEYELQLKKLLNILNKEMIEQINESIFNNSITLGYIWPCVYYILHTQYKPNLLQIKTPDVLCSEGLRCSTTTTPSFTPIGWLHWLCVFANDLKLEQIDLIGKKQVDILAIVRNVPMSEKTTVFTLEALNMIKAIHKRSDILLEKDISNCTWESIQVIIEIIRLLVAIIKSEPHHLTSTHWDFVFIGLFGWAETIRKSMKVDSNLSVLSMTSAVCDLFIEVSKFMGNIKLDVAAGDAYIKLAEEWDDVVSIEVIVRMFKIFKSAIENINETNYNEYTITLKSLCDCVKYINGSNIIRSDVKIKWRDITSDFTQLLYSSLTTQRISATIFIQNILCPYLIEMDTTAISGESPRANNHYQLSLELFITTLEKTQLVVESMIQDFKLGEQICQVKPFTEAFDYTAGYILTWSILLNMFTNASSNLRYQYTEWFRDHDYLKILMQNILRLMPEKILDPSAQATPSLMQLFDEIPKFSVSDEQTSEWIESSACGVFREILSVAPALVRQWWSGAESRVARIVERITSTFISSQLCTQELQDLSKQNTEHMCVKVHPTAREVVATYTVDEARMEIIISLPTNYPLGTVKIDCNNQIGATNQWRNSIMQLSLFLTHQNGNVNDGLTLWKNNLDKHFDGVEECYICFSVIHAGTYQLPKLSCSKCKKKFHSACLYKWFSTSNKSTCPICRSLF